MLMDFSLDGLSAIAQDFALGVSLFPKFSDFPRTLFALTYIWWGFTDFWLAVKSRFYSERKRFYLRISYDFASFQASEFYEFASFQPAGTLVLGVKVS